MHVFLLAVVAVSFGQGQPDPARNSPPRASSALVVTVGDAAGGAFIADAEVRLPTLGRTARTGWNGEARFGGLSDGEYRIQVRALGYSPGDFDARVTGDTVAVHFSMERVRAVLDTVRVSETKPNLTLAAFERRRSMGIGRFLTDSMLADDKTRSVQYVLATRFPGISVKENGIISTQPSGLMGDNECPVLIYLDGVQLESVNRKPLKLAGPQVGRGGRPPPPDPNERRIANLDIIRPDELTGVEMYSRTTAPQEYRPLGNYCKVVLLWTRFRRSPDKK